MDDTKATLQLLKDNVKKFVNERDWEKFHYPKNVSMSLAIEAAELMEKFVWVGSKASVQELEANRQEVEDEFADVVINILAFANATGIDIAQAVAAKLASTSKKYPIEKVKGSYEKYKALKKSLKK